MNVLQDRWVTNFHKHQRYIENEKFYDLLRKMLKIDYGLLIQQDSSIKTKIRYELSHFHVRIDWLLDTASESLGKQLRYISEELYEKREKVAVKLMMQLFEYDRFYYTVSRRRTATLLAAQVLRNYKFLSTVFVSSSEARTLTKISQGTIPNIP